MEWTKSADPDWDWEIEYRLVYMHFLGHTECVRMGLTKKGGSVDFDRLLAGDRNELPFRDGAHFTHDSGHFGMPMYAVTPTGTVRIHWNPTTSAKGALARRDAGER